MELVWYKEAEEEIQVVVHGHCSMGLANPDKQVGHTHGLQVAAVGSEVAAVGSEVDMEKQKHLEHGKEMAPVGSYKEEGEHTPPLLAALVADSKVLDDGDLLAVVKCFSESDVLLEGSCCCCKHLCFYHPGN